MQPNVTKERTSTAAPGGTDIGVVGSISTEANPAPTEMSRDEKARGYLLSSHSGRELYLRVAYAQDQSSDGWVSSSSIHSAMMPCGFHAPQWGALMRVSSSLKRHSLLEHSIGKYRLGEIGKILWADPDFKQRLQWKDR